MACSTKDFIEGLRCHLKDGDAVRWKDGYLAWVIEIAARQIQADRADLFKEDKKIKLSIGCVTNVCEQGCEEITKPFRRVGDDCSEIQTISSDEDWVSSYFPPIGCSSNGAGYRVERIETDIEDPCSITVVPPVPDDGMAYWIVAKCQKDIQAELMSGQLPAAVCRHLNAFTQLVLFYVFGMDSMVNADHSQAQKYFENYLVLMKLTYLNDLSNRERTIYLQQLIDQSQGRQGA